MQKGGPRVYRRSGSVVDLTSTTVSSILGGSIGRRIESHSEQYPDAERALPKLRILAFILLNA